jgi:glucose/arabinose dehydrogenase
VPAQQPPAAPPVARPRIGYPVAPLGDGPFIFDTAEQHKIRVVVMAKGLSHPWALVFLPSGDLLITERAGQLRIVRGGVLDPKPISGGPTVVARGLLGLMDIALHPQFAENRLVYFSYSKPGENGGVANAVARARLVGDALTGLRDIFQTEFWDGSGATAARIAFGRDGMLYVATGGGGKSAAQDPASLLGKVLRLTDTGEVPPDNPFVHTAGHKPEIYSLGHRNILGLAVNPVNGDLWENENGPNGGDEIDVLAPGKNYGWPLVSYGRTYEGPRVSKSALG